MMMVGLWISACAHVETRLPVPDVDRLHREAATQENLAFKRYTSMLTRLDRVSAIILAKNADICAKTRLDIGVRTHTLKSYPKHLREAAGRQLGATKTASILRANPQTAFLPADILLNEERPAISDGDKVFQKYLQDGASSVFVRRGDEIIEVPITPRAVCDYRVSLKFSGAVNAYATGKSIIVTTSMMDFTDTDEELALVVGHELAHNTMGHVRKIIQNTILSGFATRTTRPFEAEADYVGLYYMARAGYEIEGVEMFWQRLGVVNPKSIFRAKTHPITPSRLLSIRLTAQEINHKREKGEDLVPNKLRQPK